MSMTGCVHIVTFHFGTPKTGHGYKIGAVTTSDKSLLCDKRQIQTITIPFDTTYFKCMFTNFGSFIDL